MNHGKGMKTLTWKKSLRDLMLKLTGPLSTALNPLYSLMGAGVTGTSLSAKWGVGPFRPFPVSWTWKFSFLPFTWPFRPKGRCDCLCLSVCLSLHLYTLSCPHDNLSQIWAGITKLAPKMYHEISSNNLIESGGHWPWPSMSLGHFVSK